MGNCSVKKLRDKEVINVCDGRRIGFVYDVEIDICSGRVVSLSVPAYDGKCFKIGKPEEVCVPWESIVKIGDDIILCELFLGPVSEKCECERKKK